MKFLKDNSYDIVRLFINQIGITIFAIVLYLPFGTFENAELGFNLQTCVSILSTIFYLVLLYNAGWEFGSKARMRADSGKQVLHRSTGAIMSTVANLPNFIIAGLATVSISLYMTLGNDAAYATFGVLNAFMRFLSSMYIGLLRGIFDFMAEEPVQYLYFTSMFVPENKRKSPGYDEIYYEISGVAQSVEDLLALLPQ